jgi:hypothetical protein
LYRLRDTRWHRGSLLGEKIEDQFEGDAHFVVVGQLEAERPGLIVEHLMKHLDQSADLALALLPVLQSLVTAQAGEGSRVVHGAIIFALANGG